MAAAFTSVHPVMTRRAAKCNTSAFPGGSLVLRVLQFRFLPVVPDLALLVLRVWFAIPLLTLHGWGKLANFAERSSRFSDPFGIGSPASLSLAIFAEVFCSVLLVIGFATRFAALACAITMATAFFYAHDARFTGQGNGELPFMYGGAFLALLLAGGGRYSVDGKT
jgi:putative oxidoreductase